MRNETYLFSLATSSKRFQLNRMIDSGSEHSLNYGKEAVLLMIPIISTYILRSFYTKASVNCPFLREVLLEEYFTYAEELETKNKSERKWKDCPVTQSAEAISLMLASTMSKESSVLTMVKQITKTLYLIFNVDFEKREEYTKDLFRFVTGIILEVSEKSDIFVVEQRNGRENVISVTEAWFDYIAECQERIDTNTDSYAPMACPPIHHKDLISSTGGYLTMKSPLLKLPYKERGGVHQSIKDFNEKTHPDFFKMVNRVQDTPFTVNTKMFEIVTDYYQRGFFFKSNPMYIEQGEATRYAEAMSEINKRNKRRKEYAEATGKQYTPLTDATVSKVIKEHTNKTEEEVRKTEILFGHCETYSEFDKIYFPMFFDFRGRRYPYASYGLTYMGDELTKSMLNFANKERFTLTGLKNMFSNLANTLGHDKVNYLKKRVIAAKWFNEHKDSFTSGDYSIFFTNQDEFDEPINAMSICIELVQWMADDTFESGYMAHRDARCSGSSLIGSMMGDKQVMALTSVYEEVSSERLPDAYLSAANKAKEKAVEGNMTSLLKHEALFGRAAFKKPVMCRCSYGLSDYSVREGNRLLVEEEEIGDEMGFSGLSQYNSLMLDSLNEALPACTEYLHTVKHLAKTALVNNNGLMAYTTPLVGFPVVYKVFKENIFKMQAPSPYRRLTLMMKIKTDKVDGAKTRSGVPPQVLHSLDATILNLVNMDIPQIDLATIHDSIASHPNHSDTVRASYNRAIVKFNKGDILNNISRQFCADVQFTHNIVDERFILNSKHSLV